MTALLLPQEEPEEAPQAAAKGKGGKKKKSKRDISFDLLDEEDEPAAAPAGAFLCQCSG